MARFNIASLRETVIYVQHLSRRCVNMCMLDSLRGKLNFILTRRLGVTMVLLKRFPLSVFLTGIEDNSHMPILSELTMKPISQYCVADILQVTGCSTIIQIILLPCEKVENWSVHVILIYAFYAAWEGHIFLSGRINSIYPASKQKRCSLLWSQWQSRDTAQVNVSSIEQLFSDTFQFASGNYTRDV